MTSCPTAHKSHAPNALPSVYLCWFAAAESTFFHLGQNIFINFWPRWNGTFSAQANRYIYTLGSILQYSPHEDYHSSCMAHVIKQAKTLTIVRAVVSVSRNYSHLELICKHYFSCSSHIYTLPVDLCASHGTPRSNSLITVIEQWFLKQKIARPSPRKQILIFFVKTKDFGAAHSAAVLVSNIKGTCIVCDASHNYTSLPGTYSCTWGISSG